VGDPKPVGVSEPKEGVPGPLAKNNAAASLGGSLAFLAVTSTGLVISMSIIEKSSPRKTGGPHRQLLPWGLNAYGAGLSEVSSQSLDFILLLFDLLFYFLSQHWKG
jgi:hypothetical protein